MAGKKAKGRAMKKTSMVKPSPGNTVVKVVTTPASTVKPRPKSRAPKTTASRAPRPGPGGMSCCVDDQCRWKYGMFDPDFGRRGPGTSSKPTVLATFWSTTTIVPTPKSAAPGDHGTTPVPVKYQTDDSNSLLVVVTPLAPNTQGDGTMLSGFTCSPSDCLVSINSDVTTTYQSLWAAGGTNSQGSTTVGGNPVFQVSPTFLSPFTGSLPFLGTNEENSLNQYSPHRTVGLRATIENLSAAVFCQGSVSAGDFGNYQESPEKTIAPATFSSSSGEDVSWDVIAPSITDFFVKDGTLLQRFCPDIPMNVPGTIAEAVSIPTNDKWWQYSIQADNYYVNSVAAGGDSFQTMYAALTYRPVIGFLLKGVQTNLSNSFRLNVTWTIEVQVDMTSPWAFLVNQARFAPGYAPDLADLRAVASGGLLGAPLASYACSCFEGAAMLAATVAGGQPEHASGMARGMVVSSSSKERHHRTPNIAAPSPTMSAARAMQTAGFSDVISSLSKGAMNALMKIPFVSRTRGNFQKGWGSGFAGMAQDLAPYALELAAGLL